jgi:hypothetical protein
MEQRKIGDPVTDLKFPYINGNYPLNIPFSYFDYLLNEIDNLSLLDNDNNSQTSVNTYNNDISAPLKLTGFEESPIQDMNWNLTVDGKPTTCSSTDTSGTICKNGSVSLSSTQQTDVNTIPNNYSLNIPKSFKGTITVGAVNIYDKTKQSNVYTVNADSKTSDNPVTPKSQTSKLKVGTKTNTKTKIVLVVKLNNKLLKSKKLNLYYGKKLLLKGVKTTKKGLLIISKKKLNKFYKCLHKFGKKKAQKGKVVLIKLKYGKTVIKHRLKVKK